MWSIFIPGSGDALSARLWELGTSGLLEEAGGVRAYFEEAQGRASICREFGVPESAVRDEAPFDPATAPPVDMEPLPIGETLFVAPSWITTPTPPGRIRLTVDATSAFGTGRHETTQLCLEALERHMPKGASVADIGCGSGILSLAAAKLGAWLVISCDIHENSVTAARGMLDNLIFVGSADGLRSGLVDVVIANLTAKVLDLVAYDLKRITKTNGLVIISGFLAGATPKKYKASETMSKDDWACWICRPEDVSARAEASEPAAHAQQWWL